MGTIQSHSPNDVTCYEGGGGGGRGGTVRDRISEMSGNKMPSKRELYRILKRDDEEVDDVRSGDVTFLPLAAAARLADGAPLITATKASDGHLAALTLVAELYGANTASSCSPSVASSTCSSPPASSGSASSPPTLPDNALVGGPVDASARKARKMAEQSIGSVGESSQSSCSPAPVIIATTGDADVTTEVNAKVKDKEKVGRKRALPAASVSAINRAFVDMFRTAEERSRDYVHDLHLQQEEQQVVGENSPHPGDPRPTSQGIPPLISALPVPGRSSASQQQAAVVATPTVVGRDEVNASSRLGSQQQSQQVYGETCMIMPYDDPRVSAYLRDVQMQHPIQQMMIPVQYHKALSESSNNHLLMVDRNGDRTPVPVKLWTPPSSTVPPARDNNSTTNNSVTAETRTAARVAVVEATTRQRSVKEVPHVDAGRMQRHAAALAQGEGHLLPSVQVHPAANRDNSDNNGPLDLRATKRRDNHAGAVVERRHVPGETVVIPLHPAAAAVALAVGSGGGAYAPRQQVTMSPIPANLAPNGSRELSPHYRDVANSATYGQRREVSGAPHSHLHQQQQRIVLASSKDHVPLVRHQMLPPHLQQQQQQHVQTSLPPHHQVSPEAREYTTLEHLRVLELNRQQQRQQLQQDIALLSRYHHQHQLTSALSDAGTRVGVEMLGYPPPSTSWMTSSSSSSILTSHRPTHPSQLHLYRNPRDAPPPPQLPRRPSLTALAEKQVDNLIAASVQQSLAIATASARQDGDQARVTERIPLPPTTTSAGNTNMKTESSSSSRPEAVNLVHQQQQALTPRSSEAVNLVHQQTQPSSPPASTATKRAESLLNSLAVVMTTHRSPSSNLHEGASCQPAVPTTEGNAREETAMAAASRTNSPHPPSHISPAIMVESPGNRNDVIPPPSTLAAAAADMSFCLTNQRPGDGDRATPTPSSGSSSSLAGVRSRTDDVIEASRAASSPAPSTHVPLKRRWLVASSVEDGSQSPAAKSGRYVTGDQSKAADGENPTPNCHSDSEMTDSSSGRSKHLSYVTFLDFIDKSIAAQMSTNNSRDDVIGT